MPKYDVLKDRLSADGRAVVVLDWAELQDLLDGGLPASARRHRAWWSNEPQGRHAQARGWLDAGYLVDDVNLPSGPVIFKRVQEVSPSAPPVAGAKLTSVGPKPDGFASRLRQRGPAPAWWIRDIVVVGALAALVFVGQLHFDERRAEREMDANLAQQERSVRIENLRFVRERSGPDARQLRPFRGFDLVGQNLSGLSLPGADFEDADLRDADLQEADLRGASLRHTNLTEANLFGADLAGADLGGASLAGSDLTNADLTETRLSGDFRGADVFNTNFTGASMMGADLRGADLTETDFVGTDLYQTNFSGATTDSGTVFRDASLLWSIFRGADLNTGGLGGTDFTGAVLGYADFRDADLARAHFGGAELTGADFRGADLSAANFRAAHLDAADFRAADLSGVDLTVMCRYEQPPLLSAGVSVPDPDSLPDCQVGDGN